MTLYTVTAWCDRPFYARVEIEAETPQEALAKARTAIHDAPAEECDEGYYWEEWAVDAEDESDVLCHLDEPARLRVAAPNLLEALEAFLDPNLSSDNPVELEAVYAKARRVIAEAKGLVT